MVDNKVQDLLAKSKAIREKSEAITGMAKEARGTVAKMLKEHAQRAGVLIPESVWGILGPEAMAIRCQFYMNAFSGNSTAYSYWKSAQEHWFNRPGFDRTEFERLLSIYFNKTDK